MPRVHNPQVRPHQNDSFVPITNQDPSKFLTTVRDDGTVVGVPIGHFNSQTRKKSNSPPPRGQGAFPIPELPVATGPEKSIEGGVIFPDKFRKSGPKITGVVTTQDLNPDNDIYTVQFPNGDEKAFRGDDPRLRSALSRRGKRKPVKTTELAEGIDSFGIYGPPNRSRKSGDDMLDFDFDFGFGSQPEKKSNRKKDLIDDAFSIPDFDFSLGYDPEF